MLQARSPKSKTKTTALQRFVIAKLSSGPHEISCLPGNRKKSRVCQACAHRIRDVCSWARQRALLDTNKLAGGKRGREQPCGLRCCLFDTCCKYRVKNPGIVDGKGRDGSVGCTSQDRSERYIVHRNKIHAEGKRNGNGSRSGHQKIRPLPFWFRNFGCSGRPVESKPDSALRQSKV